MAQRLAKKQLSQSDIETLSRFGAQSLGKSNSDPLQAQELADLEREKVRLERRLAIDRFANSKFAERAGFSYSKLMKKLEKKPLNRLSKENSHRIVILLIVAFFFDFLQLIGMALWTLPVFGVVLSWMLNTFVASVAFLTFWFLYRHFGITFVERNLSAKGIFPIIMRILKILTAFFEVLLSFLPGITILTIINIFLVRHIDEHRKNKAELEALSAKIELLRNS